MRDGYLCIPRDPVIRKMGMFAQFLDVPRVDECARPRGGGVISDDWIIDRANPPRMPRVQRLLARIFHACPHNNSPHNLLTSLSRRISGKSLVAAKANRAKRIVPRGGIMTSRFRGGSAH